MSQIDILLRETDTLADLGLEGVEGPPRRGSVAIEDSVIELRLEDGRSVAIELRDGALLVSGYNGCSETPTRVNIPQSGRIETETESYDAVYPPGRDLPLAI